MKSTILSCDGTIIFKSKNLFDVFSENQVKHCTLSTAFERRVAKAGKMPIAEQEPIRWLTIGDKVQISSENGQNWQIDHVYSRRSLLARRAVSGKDYGHQEAQLIAANVDQLIAVFAIYQPEIKWNLLDRYLVLAEAAALDVIICLTKYDLINSLSLAYQQELHTQIENYRRLGYEIIETSSFTDLGIPALKKHLTGKSSIFVGKSGVGKTSLLNCVFNGFQQRTLPVNPVTGTGRHTTTSLTLVPLDAHSSVIDTPGIREFGLWDIDPQSLAEYFPEMRPFLGMCKFRLDCKHDEEPGCAIRSAVMSDHISPYRYRSYLKILREV